MSRRYRYDYSTNTPEQAAQFEADRAEECFDDDRPTLAELDRDEARA